MTHFIQGFVRVPVDVPVNRSISLIHEISRFEGHVARGSAEHKRRKYNRGGDNQVSKDRSFRCFACRHMSNSIVGETRLFEGITTMLTASPPTKPLKVETDRRGLRSNILFVGYGRVPPVYLRWPVTCVRSVNVIGNAFFTVNSKPAKSSRRESLNPNASGFAIKRYFRLYNITP